jgi:hypothetical protein
MRLKLKSSCVSTTVNNIAGNTMPQKRRLIPKSLLDEMTDLHQQGVPISVIIRKYRLTAHHRIVSNLIKTNLIKTPIVQNSLFPEFMQQQPEGWPRNEDKQAIVHAPDGWFYAGTWPNGVWLHHDWSLHEQQRAIDKSLGR